MVIYRLYRGLMYRVGEPSVPLAPQSAQLDERERLAIEAQITELQRLYSRIEGNVQGTGSIIGIIILVASGALAVVGEASIVIVIVAPLWSALMLYAMISDWDTRKYSFSAQRLERDLNAHLQKNVFVYESALAGRGGHKDPLIYQFTGDTTYFSTSAPGSSAALRSSIRDRGASPHGSRPHGFSRL